MHARRQGAADDRHSRQAGALYERRAVPPLHPHRDVAATATLYISDGYGNARVHKYTPDGKRVMSWGEPGTDPGQFNIRTISVATRTAGSMSPTGRTTGFRCSTATANTRRSGTTCTAPRGCSWSRHHDAALLYRRNRARHGGQYRHPELRAARQHLHAERRIAGPARPHACRARAGQFISPHGIAVDSRGDIYVGEVSYTNWGRRVRARGEEIPPGLRSLQKLVKVS